MDYSLLTLSQSKAHQLTPPFNTNEGPNARLSQGSVYALLVQPVCLLVLSLDLGSDAYAILLGSVLNDCSVTCLASPTFSPR
ncbi:hypothetical protein RRG08_048363 [Elysia crispata]|uniref:Uncharacterized protein n=1 Tax=Elysia crispata TaxID=231223 RepID=A0AAE1BA64_9GAST|nr:hypothetical protein RRG08_048363 [Elysia crispata]